MLPILKIYVRHIISVYIEFTVLCSPFGIEWKIRSERRSVFLELYKFRTLGVALICGKMPRLIKSMHGPLLTLSNQRMFILMNGSYKGRIHPYGHSLRKEEVMGWCRQSRSPIISRTRADCYRRQDFIVSVVKSFRMLATVVKLTYASLYAHHSTWCMNNQKDGKSICNKESSSSFTHLRTLLSVYLALKKLWYPVLRHFYSFCYQSSFIKLLKCLGGFTQDSTNFFLSFLESILELLLLMSVLKSLEKPDFAH